MVKQGIKKRYTLFTGKQLLFLILPIVIEQIFSTSLGMLDSIMISRIPANGGNASLAVGNVDYINHLIIQLFSAFATGGAIITSQYLGAQDNEQARKSAKQMLVLVIIFSTVIGGLCLALNYPLLKLFYSDVSPEVFSYQQTYFFVTACSFPFIGLFNACAALLRVQRKSLFTMLSAGISCVLNVGLNAVFLFVAGMGVLGVGLATLICRAIPAIFMLILLANRKNAVCVRIFEKFRFDGKMIKRILKLAIPSGIESCLFQLGKLMTNTFVNAGCYVQPVLDSAGNPVLNQNGLPQTANIQANGNTIANQINNIASVVGGGVGNSCLTVIGQAVGTGDAEQCKYYMKRMFLLSYIANGVCVGLILCLVPFIVNLYGFAVEAKEIGKQCLYFCLAFQFVTYPLSFTTPAILEATSDVKYIMFSAVISMFVMRVGLAFLLTTDKIAGLPQLGAFGYWIGMCSDWVLRSVLFLSRLLTGRWKKASGLIKIDENNDIGCKKPEKRGIIKGKEADMGRWSMSISASDEYEDVRDGFFKQFYYTEKPIEDIEKSILDEYREQYADFEADDGVWHDVYFALAECERACGGLSETLLQKVEEIIDGGRDLAYMESLEASPQDLKERKKALEKFLKKLKTPNENPIKRKLKKPFVNPFKTGDVFLYRLKERYYGGVVLQVSGDKDCGDDELDYCIAVSELNSDSPLTAEQIENSTVRCVEWLIPDNLPKIGKFEIIGNVAQKLAVDYGNYFCAYKTRYGLGFSGWFMIDFSEIISGNGNYEKYLKTYGVYGKPISYLYDSKNLVKTKSVKL